MTDTLYDQYALARELGMHPPSAPCHHHLIVRAHHLQHRSNNLCKAVGPLTLALSRRERGQRLLGVQHLLDQRIGFCHVPVREEGER